MGRGGGGGEGERYLVGVVVGRSAAARKREEGTEGEISLRNCFRRRVMREKSERCSFKGGHRYLRDQARGD